MEISFIRHGKSKQIDSDKVNSSNFAHWVQKYNQCGVFAEESYPLTTIKKIKAANLLITSDLKRSMESANLLHQQTQTLAYSLFRETELPIPQTKLAGIKLKPSTWTAILRCLWFCGYSSNCESFSDAKERAKHAANELIHYAQKHHSVVFVGHGFINLFIAKELQKLGWKGPHKPSSKHWNCTTYSFNSSP